MPDSPSAFDYLLEIPSAKWIMHETPRGRPIGCIDFIADGDNSHYSVTAWHENPDYAAYLGRTRLFRDACRLAYTEGRKRTPPVEQTKWTEDMVKRGKVKHG